MAGPMEIEFKRLTSIALTPLDVERINFIRHKCGLRTVTDAIRQALVDAVEKRGGLPAAAPVVSIAAAAPPVETPSGLASPTTLPTTVPPNVPVQDTTLYRCGGCGKKFRVLSTVTDPECPHCAGEAP